MTALFVAKICFSRPTDHFSSHCSYMISQKALSATYPMISCDIICCFGNPIHGYQNKKAGVLNRPKLLILFGRDGWI